MTHSTKTNASIHHHANHSTIVKRDKEEQEDKTSKIRFNQVSCVYSTFPHVKHLTGMIMAPSPTTTLCYIKPELGGVRTKRTSIQQDGGIQKAPAKIIRKKTPINQNLFCKSEV